MNNIDLTIFLYSRIVIHYRNDMIERGGPVLDKDLLLIQRMRMGDEAGIDRFIEKYYSRIYKYCRMHLSDAYLAEDLTQETFFRFFSSFDQWAFCGNYPSLICSRKQTRFKHRNRCCSFWSCNI